MSIDEAIQTSGSAFATKRFQKYRGTVHWKHHSVYYGFEIFRAYHNGNGKPAGLYACNISNLVLIIGDTLDDIRSSLRSVKGADE